MTEYRDIRGWPGYRTGADGTVWSRWKRRGRRGIGGGEAFLGETWWQLRPSQLKRGYLQVAFYRDGKRTRRQLHCVVLETFRGSRPDGMECRHLDGNPANNRLENLAWGTPVENQADRVVHGTDSRGERCVTSKLAESQVREAIRDLERGITQREVARKFGVHQRTIHRIVHHECWNHLWIEPKAEAAQEGGGPC